MNRYPHQLSGGQQQRIAIARAIILKPRLIVADEPLSSLDVSVQTQLLELSAELKRKTDVGFVIISHDVNAVEAIADRILVMYRGRIVEAGRNVLAAPRHPYTQTLIDARLIPDPRLARAKVRLVHHAETVSAKHDDEGCRFRPRCSVAMSICETSVPSLESCGEWEEAVACHFARRQRSHELAIAGRAPQ
jgi:oligopeptide/dipeptide ABC transporter ATP-binding protein